MLMVLTSVKYDQPLVSWDVKSVGYEKYRVHKQVPRLVLKALVVSKRSPRVGLSMGEIREPIAGHIRSLPQSRIVPVVVIWQLSSLDPPTKAAELRPGRLL